MPLVLNLVGESMYISPNTCWKGSDYHYFDSVCFLRETLHTKDIARTPRFPVNMLTAKWSILRSSPEKTSPKAPVLLTKKICLHVDESLNHKEKASFPKKYPCACGVGWATSLSEEGNNHHHCFIVSWVDACFSFYCRRR